MATQSQQNPQGEHPQMDDEIRIDDFSPTDSIYTPPAVKSVKEILGADTNDESLQKYKKQLLSGNSAEGVVIVDANNPLNVIFTNLSVVVDSEVKHSVPLPPKEEFTVFLKEGCVYHIQFEFYVQREIVTGLKYLHRVSRMGVGVGKETQMLGSFAPRQEPYVYSSNTEEAPHGLLSRGKYRVRSLITDDDKHRWLEWIWHIEITKDWHHDQPSQPSRRSISLQH